MAFKGHNRQGYAIIKETESTPGTITETLSGGTITQHTVSFKASSKKETVELYAGDRLDESEDGATSGDVSLDVSQLELKDEAALGGHTFDASNGMTCKDSDTAPYVRYAAIGVGKKNNVDFFRLVKYYKVKFGDPDDDFESKKKSVTFKTHSLQGTCMANCEGKTKDKQDFDTFDKALAAMKTFLGISAV